VPLFSLFFGFSQGFFPFVGKRGEFKEIVRVILEEYVKICII
jgi:hypothetical protein